MKVGNLVKMKNTIDWNGEVGVVVAINRFWWVIDLTSGMRIITKDPNRVEVLNESG
jgi:transcription elongation factor